MYVAAVCGNLGLALRLNFESTRLNVTSLTLHLDYPLPDCSAAGPGSNAFTQDFRGLGICQEQKRSEHRWIIARRDGCCHLPRACSVEAERCSDANGRVVYFYLDCKTSSLSESQPYACYTIAGSFGHVTRSNKATWVGQSNAVLRVAKEVEVIGSAVTKMTNCDRAKRISRAKASGEESGIKNVVGSV